MTDSRFRQLFEYLGQLHGRQLEWPQLIRHIIDEETNQLRSDGTPYVSEVFIDRDEKYRPIILPSWSGLANFETQQSCCLAQRDAHLSQQS
jgi:hypothetical protein